MSKGSGVLNTSGEDVCVVCFRSVDTYSVGECDHPVCYECSTRMRVLCARNECPICRKEMAKVVFTKEVVPFNSIVTRDMHYERRYAIFFESEVVMRAYDSLLEHRCKECHDQPVFRNFTQLKDHMRKYHESFYCELCVDHLKIFTHERRSYTRSQLAQHRRKGDIDDRSHRGHPLCEFCDSRFMDNDELFRHLRRDHFFCHFCDADGSHQYYDDYNALRKHFRTDHYLCEEGDCQEERFTSVFRTKLDLQAHNTQNHSHNMSKQAARQARTVDIEFTVNHRPQDSHRQDDRPGRGGRGPRGRGGRGGRRDRDRDYDDQRLSDELDSRAPPPPPQNQQHSIDINCVQDFPSLKSNGQGAGGDGGGAGASKSMATHLAQQNRFTIRTRGGTNLMEEEFPSLRPGSTSTSVTVTSTPQATSHSTSTPTTSLHLKVNTKKQSRGDPQGSNRGSNVSIQYNRTPLPTQADSKPTPDQDRSKGGPQIGVISHSSNITLQSSSKGAEEDFPALVSSKGRGGGGSSSFWGGAMSQPAITSTKPSTKVVTNDFPSLGPSSGAPSVTSSKPGKKFNPRDFPSLAPNADSQTHMQNYHGHSSVTIPVSNAWTHSVDHVPKPSEPNENVMGSKGKKKKKGQGKTTAPASQVSDTGGFGQNSQNMISNGTSKPKSGVKKKPLGLHNIFDDSDDEEAPKIDLSMGRLGEYESVAPQQSSNVKMITQDTIQERKKSELKIGKLKSPQSPPPVMESEEAFPTLGNTTSNASPLTTSTWSSPAKKSAPPGFSSKPKVPPGFSATDMTFTSSSGEKFAISPTSEGAVSTNFTDQHHPPSYKFSHPPDFELRNKNLITTIQNECQGQEDKFMRFKFLANQLRSGELSGQVYYESCRSLMGKATFLKLLPELLVLLPDIKNQQEVLAAYRKIDGGRGCSTLFAVCVVCRQVLSQADFNAHMFLHNNTTADFPSLSQASANILK